MVTKVQNLGAYRLTPVTYYTVTNGVRASTGGSTNTCTHADVYYRTWQTTLNWKSKLESQGYLNTLPYQHMQDITKARALGGGFVEFRRKDNPRNGYDYVMPWEPSLSAAQHAHPSHDANLLLDAQNKARAKARNMRVNLAVATAEGRKTVQMMWDGLQTLGKAYKSFRKGRFKQAARDLKIGEIEEALANNWLAYQYGWKPLISDCAGLAETHREQMASPREQVFKVVARKTQVVTGHRKITNFVLSNHHAHAYSTDVFVARAGMLLECTSKVDQFQASVGLSPSDILLTAWELVPFSFVFDWFVDVGTWLGQLGSLDGLSVLDAWTDQTTSRANWVVPGTDGSIYTSNLGGFLSYSRRYVRNPWNPGTMTWPRVNSVTDLSWQRLISAASLLSQQTRGDPPIGKFRPTASD